MRRKADIFLRGVAGIAFYFLCVAPGSAAPNQNQTSVAAAESPHAAAAPAPRPAESAPAPEPARSAAPAQQPTASPRATAMPINTNQGSVNQAQQNIIYYPLGYASAFWDPNWNPYNDYNNYNGYNSPAYPAQFTQPDADNQTEPPSVNSQVVPDLAPALPVTAVNTSAALNAALVASPQWRQADAQVRVAQAQYDAAASLVLAQLRTQPSYQQALAHKAADAQKVASLKARDPSAPITSTEAVAAAKLDAAQTVTQMQNAALAVDPRASAAKIKLDTAIAQRLELRRAIQASLSHPTPQQ